MSAIIIAINIPFALFFSIIIIVLRGEDANLLSLGAIDFGIVVDSAVILVENIFRVFQASEREALLKKADSLPNGGNQDQRVLTRIRLIYVGAIQVESAILFSTLIILAAFLPAFHDARSRRPDLRPDGANLCLCACWGAPCDLYIHSCARVVSLA